MKGGSGPEASPISESAGGDEVAASRGLRWFAAGALAIAAMSLILLGKKVPPPLVSGVAAPRFELPLLDAGHTLKLAQFRDRIVLLNFWATWCKPCEDEMPAMQRLYDKLRDEPFELLAISVDDDLEELRSFQKRLGVTFPILMDPSQAVTRQYQTTGFPESILVDRDGRVVERYIGPRDWDAEIYESRIRHLVGSR